MRDGLGLDPKFLIEKSHLIVKLQKIRPFDSVQSWFENIEVESDRHHHEDEHRQQFHLFSEHIFLDLMRIFSTVGIGIQNGDNSPYHSLLYDRKHTVT